MSGCCSAQASRDRETTCQSAPSACPSPIFTNASRWAGSARSVSSGQRAASASASPAGTAPLDRTVAVLADLTPEDAEERAGAARDLRQPVAPEQRDELLAERPRR